VRQLRYAIPRHAIDAAQIAAIGHGNAQIIEFAPMVVFKQVRGHGATLIDLNPPPRVAASVFTSKPIAAQLNDVFY
jgi:hypothetical protein